MEAATTASQLAHQLGEKLHKAGVMLVTAESCTGGWVAREITAIAGCSQWFERGFVTYTNISKQEMLGVSEQTLVNHGAVSEQVVSEMARGAINNSHARLAVAITGIAGPGGGSVEKPVGTVWFAWANSNGEIHTDCQHIAGDREQVRQEAVIIALQGLITFLDHP